MSDGSKISDEGRRFKRISTNWIVRIRSRSPSESTRLRLDERIKNVSIGGVFIETHYPFPMGSYVEFEFQVPGQKGFFQAKGVVRWSNDGKLADRQIGMGIEFVEVAAAAQEVIEATATGSQVSTATKAMTALISTPDHQNLLRFYQANVGETVRMDRLAKKAPVDAAKLVEVLNDFATHGLVELSGKKVRLVPIEDDKLRKSISDWVADHPAAPAAE